MTPVDTREELGESSCGTQEFRSTGKDEIEVYFLDKEEITKVVEQRELILG